jgi:hypothetical protein
MVSDYLASTPNARPAKNRSQAYSGTAPADILKWWARKYQPFPKPAGEPPYHIALELVAPGVEEAAAKAGKIVFNAVGDTGPIMITQYHDVVAQAMAADLAKPASERPAFFYHLGDVVYNHGKTVDYYDQFYRPYANYSAPILGIPGNHDADPEDELQPSLDGWMAYFMAGQPHIHPVSGNHPKPTMPLPNVYYTLNCPFVTIIGLYTNVPEHGIIGRTQLQWFINELQTASKHKAVVVCLHNPVYSFDAQHSGSPLMGQMLAEAINTSRRVPNMVLSAHVHNYQRIEKEMVSGQPTPFFVAGNGGYYQLHVLVAEDGAVDELTGAKLVKAQNRSHGYLEITVDKENITGKSLMVNKTTGAVEVFDSFSYPAGALLLKEGETVGM